ncbi:MAG: hypothetical protein FD136_1995 [Chitinophagaceae bacterium]|nr:MAG: hypothetical protein FD136_1995 [Chitinophagaceae bacterium]
MNSLWFKNDYYDLGDRTLFDYLSLCKEHPNEYQPFLKRNKEGFNLDSKNVPPYLKVYIGNIYNWNILSSKELSKLTGLNIRTITYYGLSISRQKMLYNNGRPSYLPEESCEKIAKVIIDSDVKKTNKYFVPPKYQITKKNLINLMNEEKDTVKREFHVVYGLNKDMHRSTIYRVMQDLNAHTGNAEITTTPRSRAMASVANQVSLGASVVAILGDPNKADFGMKNIEGNRLYNSDSATFGIHLKDSRIQVVYIGKRPDHLMAEPDPSDHSNDMDFFIKFYFLLNAAGQCGTPVFIIGHKHMAKDAIDIYELDGFGLDNSGLGKGIIIILNSRGCSLKFYEYYFEHVVLPFIMATRPKQANKSPDISKSVLYQIDGEATQIAPFKSNKTNKLFKDKNIDVLKSSASDTAIQQPADAGKAFMAARAVIENNALEETYYINPTDSNSILEIIKAHNDKYPTKNKISDDHKTKIIKGLQKCRFALQDKINRGTMQKSFSVTGHFPFDLITMLGNTRTRDGISDEEIDNINNTFPLFVNIMKQRGQITEDEFEANNIPGTYCSNTKKPQHQLCISRRRCTILTNPHIFDEIKVEIPVPVPVPIVQPIAVVEYVSQRGRKRKTTSDAVYDYGNINNKKR